MIFDTEYIQEDNRIPKGCVLMCSCDSLYFEEHAPALIHSANYFKENLHIHIVNESLAAKNLKKAIVRKFDNITFTSEITDLSGTDART